MSGHAAMNHGAAYRRHDQSGQTTAADAQQREDRTGRNGCGPLHVSHVDGLVSVIAGLLVSAIAWFALPSRVQLRRVTIRLTDCLGVIELRHVVLRKRLATTFAQPPSGLVAGLPCPRGAATHES